MKRFAANYLQISNGTLLKRHIIEINERGEVVKYFPLIEEIESIEWRPGIIILHKGKNQKNEQVTYAELWYPYDFISMKPVDGTQHIQLK